MITIFQRIFKPKEVKAILLAMDIEENRLQKLKYNSPFSPLLGFNLVKTHIRKKVIIQSNASINTIHNGTDPRTAVYLLIANHTSLLLRSGQYHLRQGYLSMPGLCILSIFKLAITELEEARTHSPEDSIKAIRQIHDDISAMG